MKVMSTDALTELIQLSKNNFLDKNNTLSTNTATPDSSIVISNSVMSVGNLDCGTMA